MELTIWRTSTAMASPIQGAAQRHDLRDHLFVSIEQDGVVGYGEVSPQPETLNGDPSTAAVLEAARVELAVHLERIAIAARDEDGWARIHQVAGPRGASKVAWALVEMALLDLALRRHGGALADRWPQIQAPRVMATASLLDEAVPPITSEVERLRLKVAPGVRPGPRLEAVHELGRPVIVDYNCAARDVDQVREDLDVLTGSLVVVAVEQPFAPGNLIDHAHLAAAGTVAVSLDEGVRSVADLRHIARYGAAALVCIKPARVGGLAVARTMILEANALGLRPYVGGFFETPLARSVHRQLAAAMVQEPSDVGTVAGLAGAPVTVRSGGLGWAPQQPSDDAVLVRLAHG
ncbi:MAG: hypothetical protein KGJ92_08895 [Actinomycetales bacterium]|nr:hypothetical protein [Actinomycetales bacterium]